MKNKVLKSENGIIEFSKLSHWKMSFVGMILILFGFSQVADATDFVVDKAASKVNWEAKKVTGKHDGSISFENGSVVVTANKISGGTFVINMKSMVDEDIKDADMNKKLMGHLSSDDFFSIEKFPESKMVIKTVTPVSGTEFHFVADLTIKGVTNPVEFNANVTLTGDKLEAKGVITVNRTLFGIKYGSGSFFQGLGDKVIYDDFTLAFNVVAQKK